MASGRSRFVVLSAILATAVLVLVSVAAATPARVQGIALQGGADEGRYGLTGLASRPSYDAEMQNMGISWYMNWHFVRDPGDSKSGPYEFMPMALPPWRPADNCGSAQDGVTITQKILAGDYPAGTTWLIGNEVGANWSGATQAWSATTYAQRYYTCYRLLKGISPANATIAGYGFKIANGSVLPNSSGYVGATSGLDWFRQVRTEYQRLYGSPMPVDVYNIHLYGRPNDQGYYFLVNAVTMFRAAMANEWNDRQKPLIVTEMGVIESWGWDAAVSHLNRMMDYLQSATDSGTGYTADGNRLVQRWAWYSPLCANRNASGQCIGDGYGNYYHSYLWESPSQRTVLGQAYITKAWATATPTSAPTQTGTTTRTPTPIPSATSTSTPYVKRANVGGPQYTDGKSNVWEADQGYVTGGWGYTYGSVGSTASGIDNTSEPALFQTYRSWPSSATPGYGFTLPNGLYELTLRFVDPTSTAAGQRVFEVRSEGVTLPGMASFDIFAAAGGRNRAIDRTFQVTVTDGWLQIGFIHLGRGDPLLAAVEVKALTAGVPTSTPTSAAATGTATRTPTRTATATNTPILPTSTRTATGTSTSVPPTGTRTPTATNTPVAPPVTSTATATETISNPTATGTATVVASIAHRVNAGGGVYAPPAASAGGAVLAGADASGQVWAADQPYTPGGWGYTYGVAGSTSSAIEHTDEDALYQNYRTWASSSTPAYSFTLPNGRYEVTMKFMEPTASGPNQRRFEIRSQGATVHVGMDIFAAAGGRLTATDFTFEVDVWTGVLHVGVVHLGVGNPLVSAIEVRSLNDGNLPSTMTPTRTSTSGVATATPSNTPAPPAWTATPTQTNAPALPTATPTPVTGSPAMRRVNAGGGAFTDVYGQLWEADRAYVSGGWGYTYGSTAATASAIDNTNDDALFQAYRSWTSSSTPAYSFTLPNGRYEVTMKFMEPTATGAGQRRFEIRSQGATVQAGFDIFAAAGRLKAVDYSFQVDVTGGVLHIGMVHLGVGNPLVSAVEVRSLNGGTPAATSTPTRTNTSIPPTATSTPTRTSTTVAGPTSTPTRTPVPYTKFVNAGGASYTDGSGNVWLADRPYSDGDWGYTWGAAAANSANIVNTTDDTLYWSERYWTSSVTPGYTFEVPAGRYEVSFRFAETEYNGANQRKFDVRIRGNTVIAALDIYAAAGGKNRAVDRVVTVDVPDGLLNIGFIHLGVGNPKINTLYVRQVN